MSQFDPTQPNSPHPDPVPPPQPDRPDINSPEAAEAQKAAEENAALAIFGDMPRSLTAAEWSSAGVRKLLIDKISNLAEENRELRRFREAFHSSDKHAAILQEKLQSSTAFEILNAAAFAIGGSFVSLGPFFYSTSIALCFITIPLGLLLIGGACVSKWFQRTFANSNSGRVVRPGGSRKP
jgi:hypothetical protein